MDALTATKGFTLPELMTVVAIMGILAAIGLPAFNDSITIKQLENAAEQYAGHLKYAHTEAMKRNSNLYVSATAGNSWCYAISSSQACSCGTANSCTLDGAPSVFSSSPDFSSVSLTLEGYTTSNGNSYVEFEPVRGTVNHTGIATFSAHEKSISVTMSRLGVVSTCSNQLAGYPSC